MSTHTKNPGGQRQPGLKLIGGDTFSLPYSLESEQYIIGCVLQHSKLFEEAQSKLTHRDFYDKQTALLWLAFGELASQQIPIDEVTVWNWIRQKGLESEITFTVLGTLRDLAITLETLPYHVEKIKQLSQRRKQIEACERFRQAVLSGADEERIAELEAKLRSVLTIQTPNDSTSPIRVCDYTPTPQTWLLENAIPDGFPTTIYADGGLGKSYFATYLAILACLGGQEFLGLRFPADPVSTLYLDWELDTNEFSRRAKKLATGLDLAKIPENLLYLSPGESLYRFFPRLSRLVEKNAIGFVILDSLGASSIDPEAVVDIVDFFSKLKGLAIPTLIIDHQAKLQANDSYDTKTPFGSVYKGNLSRSVFQLSCIGREENQISLMLKHKKSNFGNLLQGLVFDISFQGDRVVFYKSKTITPEERDLTLVQEAMVALESKNIKTNQKNLVAELRGVLGRNTVLTLLEKGTGKLWDTERGDRRERIYKTKSLKIPPIYTRDFKLLENKDEDEEIEIPEVFK